MPVSDCVRTSTKEYWDRRFEDGGLIWGDLPSRTAVHALSLFEDHGIKSILIPGSGYGRNARFFSGADFIVSGVEVSEAACRMAQDYDPHSVYYEASALDMGFLIGPFDAVYCFNVLHLFARPERELLLRECVAKVRDDGLMFFVVFSELDPDYGKGPEVEPNTFESKPGRPVHYFTEEDLLDHLRDFEVLETGLIEDSEDHGIGPHIHALRYICARK